MVMLMPRVAPSLHLPSSRTARVPEAACLSRCLSTISGELPQAQCLLYAASCGFVARFCLTSQHRRWERRCRCLHSRRWVRCAETTTGTVLPQVAAAQPPEGSKLPEVYQVPERWRRETGIPEFQDHGVQYISLASVFPEAAGIADVFDEDAEFRRQLRWAAREDLFDPIARFSAKVNAKIKAMDGTLLCTLRPPDRCEEPRPCPELTSLFRKYGWSDLTGAEFLERLFRICGEVTYVVQHHTKPSGSFSDIVTRGCGDHMWHQDSGWNKLTVLLGFPPEDRYQGEGVFTNIALLSHPLPVPEKPVPLVFGETHCIGESMPKECIWRPLYAKGSEILVYNDSTTVHSAPDVISRESMWRLQ